MSSLTVNNYKFKCFLVFFTFLFLTGGVQFLYLKLGGSSDRSAGNIYFQIAALALYGIHVYLLFTKHSQKSLINLLLNNKAFFAFLIFSLISFTWSIEFGVSLRRSLALALCTLFCIYVAIEYKFSTIIKMIWAVCVFVCISGYLAALVPGVGTDPSNFQYPNAWRGFTGNKTDFGRFMAIGFLTSIYLFSIDSLKLKRFLVSIVFFLPSLYFSQASTPIAILCFLLILIPLIQYISLGELNNGKFIPAVYRVVLIVIIIPLAIYLIYFSYFYAVDVLGKDLTLTGRTSIWEYGLIKAKDHFWLGTGYRTFWVDSNTYDFFVYNPYWGAFVMNNGHNGFIDVYLETGIIGLILFIIFLGAYCKRLFIKRLITDHFIKKQIIFSLALLLFYLGYSITEQVTLEQSDLFWMLLVITHFSVSKMKLDN